MPLSGEIVAFNEALEDEPEKVNSDPYGEGWMIKIKLSDTSEIDDLMSDADLQGISGCLISISIYWFSGWMVFITALSLMSFPDDNSLYKIPYFDKVVHFFFYFTASVLGCLFGREQTSGKNSKLKVLLITVFGLIIYGILIEVIQSSFTTYRSGELIGCPGK